MERGSEGLVKFCGKNFVGLKNNTNFADTDRFAEAPVRGHAGGEL